MTAENQFTGHGPYAPLPVRLVNGLARQAKPVFDRLALLQSDKLQATAVRQTGLQDWGDSRLEVALAALLESVNQDGKSLSDNPNGF